MPEIAFKDPWYIWKYHISYKDREELFVDTLDYLSNAGMDISCIGADIYLIKSVAKDIAKFHYKSAIERYLRDYCEEDAEIIADGIEYMILDKVKKGFFKKRLVTDFKPRIEWKKLSREFRKIVLDRAKQKVKDEGGDVSWLTDELFKKFLQEDDFYKITEHDFTFGIALLHELAELVGYYYK